MNMERHPIRAVALLSKQGSPEAERLRHAMCVWFGQRLVPCLSFAYDHSAENLLERTEGVDIVIVLGGDGTFVSAARQLAREPRPMIGVNLGRVGFLAEVNPALWQASFARMLECGVLVEECLVLDYVLEREGREARLGIAVNDLVVSRGGPARLVSLALTVDGMHLAVLRADGLIIATPTGSTGYTSSARGPFLQPQLAAYAVTPICPFMSNFLPMVVSGETRFCLTVTEPGPEIYLTVDGQEALELREGDVLHVTGHKGGIRFGRIDGEGYFAKLRCAGFVRDFSA